MTNKVSLPIVRLDDGLPLPAYAYEGDAGLDLMSTVDIALEPLQRAAIPTGIAVAIPKGYAGFVLPRSGMALKHGLSIVNAPGLIDSNYRGELRVIAINLDMHSPIVIKRGDRIAQLVIQEVPVVALTEVASLDDTERGTNGFGSSNL